MTGVATAIGASAVIGGISSSKTNKSNERAAAAASQPKLLEEVKPDVNRLLGDLEGNQTRSTFGGDRVADFTGNQEQGLGMVQALQQQLQQQQGTVGQGFQDFASGSMIGANPFIEDQIRGIEADASANLERNLLPQVANNAVQAGGIGGSRQGIAQGVAIGDTQRGVTNASANLRANQTQQDIANQLSALQNQGSILGGQTNALDLLLETGGMQQQQNQAEIGGEQNAFNEEQDNQFNRDQQLLSILLGTPVGQGQVPNTTNPLAAGVGTGLAAQQLFGQPTPGAVPVVPQGIGANATPGFNPASTAPQFING